MQDFLGACEANYLTLSLYLSARDGAHSKTIQAYDELHRAYQALHAHSEALKTHNEKLAGEYQRLLDHCVALEEAYQKLATAYRAATHPDTGTLPANDLPDPHSTKTDDKPPADCSTSESANG